MTILKNDNYLIFEQFKLAYSLALMLFLMSAGLTLIFGVMGLVNLAHGSFYMIGAICAALVAGVTGFFLVSARGCLCGAAIAGVLIEIFIIRRLYRRDHLDQF